MKSEDPLGGRGNSVGVRLWVTSGPRPFPPTPATPPRLDPGSLVPLGRRRFRPPGVVPLKASVRVEVEFAGGKGNDASYLCRTRAGVHRAGGGGRTGVAPTLGSWSGDGGRLRTGKRVGWGSVGLLTNGDTLVDEGVGLLF